MIDLKPWNDEFKLFEEQVNLLEQIFNLEDQLDDQELFDLAV